MNEETSEPEGTISRRTVLGAGAGAAGAAFLGTTASGAPAASATAPAVAKAKEAARGTTLRRTIVHGPPGTGGYRLLTSGPGEPYLVRDDLSGRAGAGRSHRRRTLVAFGHLTDQHIIDAQSPARTEFLDRLDDPGSPFAGLGLSGAYRAQEMLSAQVAESMVQAMNRVRRGPATGAPVRFTMCTGDNVDNMQYNELRWQIDLLDGERIRPDSGDLTRWEGVADWESYDVHYWHPDGTPPGQSDDLRRANSGFPTVPGLLDAARRPFRATGLRTPWLSTFGNHDGLVQGTVAASELTDAIATGNIKITDLPPGVDLIALLLGILAGDPAALQLLFSGPRRIVTADPDRRQLSRAETIAEHFRTSGWPRGHGYTRQNLRTGNAYYAFDQGQVRCLVLDSVNQNGGSDGSIDSDQLTWLTDELTAGSRQHLDETGKLVRGGRHDRLFVLFSHHTIGTMTNNTGPGRVLGPQLRDLLLRFPNVVLWVNGHTHRNNVIPYRRAAGSPVPGGFWEVNTAAHIDWPQQARVVELVDNRDGTLSVFGTIVDHAAPRRPGRHPRSPLELAALSRELSVNDWQHRGPSQDARGGIEDRNVELLIPAPFASRF